MTPEQLIRLIAKYPATGEAGGAVLLAREWVDATKGIPKWSAIGARVAANTNRTSPFIRPVSPSTPDSPPLPAMGRGDR